ncbi:hypothetical protein DYB25_004415 [Aphanomyces astaci]|uniref:Uncharacterized protein n=1 Tax=Aphanomyces astaci TaxID=112090 RepID=A0A396ZWL2_APHAT|nr:hypothetical protein DYB25_004415 [Aphanomyces astaci]
MENAKTASQAPSSTRPKQQHERIKASSIGPCPKDSLATLDATGMALQSVRIVAVMRANPQDDPTQVVCVHELLYVLRHDPSDFTLHKLMTHDIIPFLLKLVREFRFHAVLLTMALHPTEDRLQQYTTSLLQTLRYNVHTTSTISQPRISIRTTAVPTGRVAGKPAGFEIAFFNNEYAASNRPATTTLWTPVTGEGSCHKHRASLLEPFQLVIFNLISKLLSHSISFAADAILNIHLYVGSLPRHNNPGGILGRKPATSVKRLAPMLVTTPTLGAYRSSPLFVEPLDTAKRVDALHGRMMSTRGPCRPSVSFASVVVNIGATYLSQGEYLKALEAFEIAHKMHPHHPKAMYNAGLAHWHLGHSQLAATKVLTKHQTM